MAAEPHSPVFGAAEKTDCRDELDLASSLESTQAGPSKANSLESIADDRSLASIADEWWEGDSPNGSKANLHEFTPTRKPAADPPRPQQPQAWPMPAKYGPKFASPAPEKKAASGDALAHLGPKFAAPAPEKKKMVVPRLSLAQLRPFAPNLPARTPVPEGEEVPDESPLSTDRSRAESAPMTPSGLNRGTTPRVAASQAASAMKDMVSEIERELQDGLKNVEAGLSLAACPSTPGCSQSCSPRPSFTISTPREDCSPRRLSAGESEAQAKADRAWAFEEELWDTSGLDKRRRYQIVTTHQEGQGSPAPSRPDPRRASSSTAELLNAHLEELRRTHNQATPPVREAEEHVPDVPSPVWPEGTKLERSLDRDLRAFSIYTPRPDDLPVTARSARGTAEGQALAWEFEDALNGMMRSTRTPGATPRKPSRSPHTDGCLRGRACDRAPGGGFTPRRLSSAERPAPRTAPVQRTIATQTATPLATPRPLAAEFEAALHDLQLPRSERRMQTPRGPQSPRTPRTPRLKSWVTPVVSKEPAELAELPEETDFWAELKGAMRQDLANGWGWVQTRAKERLQPVKARLQPVKERLQPVVQPVLQPVSERVHAVRLLTELVA